MNSTTFLIIEYESPQQALLLSSITTFEIMNTEGYYNRGNAGSAFADGFDYDLLEDIQTSLHDVVGAQKPLNLNLRETELVVILINEVCRLMLNEHTTIPLVEDWYPELEPGWDTQFLHGAQKWFEEFKERYKDTGELKPVIEKIGS